jgi:cytochrome c556
MIRQRSILALFLLFLSGQTILLAWPAEDDKPLDAHTIMEKANKPGGPYFNVVRELKAKDPDWDDVLSDSEEINRLASALGKTTPAKGDAASWKNLSAAYADTARALEKAARGKNLGAARAAIARMGEPSCTACHKLHRQD